MNLSAGCGSVQQTGMRYRAPVGNENIVRGRAVAGGSGEPEHVPIVEHLDLGFADQDVNDVSLAGIPVGGGTQHHPVGVVGSAQVAPAAVDDIATVDFGGRTEGHDRGAAHRISSRHPRPRPALPSGTGPQSRQSRPARRTPTRSSRKQSARRCVMAEKTEKSTSCPPRLAGKSTLSSPVFFSSAMVSSWILRSTCAFAALARLPQASHQLARRDPRESFGLAWPLHPLPPS